MKHSRALLLLALTLCSCRYLIRPRPVTESSTTILIVCAGNLDWARLPQLATLVKESHPAITVLAGDFLDLGPLTYVSQGRAQLAVLSEAGVNTICLTPGFLKLGISAARRLLDSTVPGIAFLGANVVDSVTQMPFGQAYVRTSVPASTGSVRLGLIGVVTDSASPYVSQDALRYLNPVEAARKSVPALRMSADLVGVVSSGSLPETFPGVDFRLGKETPSRPGYVSTLELRLDQNLKIIQRRNALVDLSGVKPDSGVRLAVNRWQQETDSLLRLRLSDADRDYDTIDLRKLAARAAPALLRADGTLFANGLILRPLARGPVTLARLFDAAGPENQLVKVQIEGFEIDKLLPSGEPGIEWKRIIGSKRIVQHHQYDVVTTLAYLRSHPQWNDRPWEFQPFSLAQVLAHAFPDQATAEPDTLE